MTNKLAQVVDESASLNWKNPPPPKSLKKKPKTAQNKIDSTSGKQPATSKGTDHQCPATKT